MAFGNSMMGVPPEIQLAYEKLGAAKSAEVEAICDGLLENIIPMFKEQAARISALENRLAEIEKRGIKFQGTFTRGADYARGSMVVSSGSLWAAVRDTAAGEAEPGKGPAWALCAKAGRDAR